MRLATRLLLQLNRLFPLPSHPFNLARQDLMSYAEWQFRQASATLANYSRFATPAEMVAGKVIIDIGSGAGGKAVYYAAQGARKVFGIEIVPYYREQAADLAFSKQLDHVAEFMTGDAVALPFADASADAVFANDVMEHLPDPPAALREIYRVLRDDGRLYVDFPPYHHPYGAHLSDAIGIPWVHAFFAEPVLIEAYRHLLRGVPDGERRLRFRLGASKDGAEHLEYINGMRIARFRDIVRSSPFQVRYWREIPLRPPLRPLAALFPEFFVRAVVCVLSKR